MSEKFQQLGRYLLVDRLGTGGMADVYRAKLFGVAGFEKDVAIKKILPHWSNDQEFVDMLVDEAKVLLHLNHPNIVQVNELNREDQIHYIVMEYMDGVDLRKLTQKLKRVGRVLPVPLVLFIMQQIALGLAYAHDKRDRAQNPLGIVHRDISPQNILINFDGQVKITDFGIAKVLGRTNETAAGTLKGKFSYMSPEQAMGQKIDARTDIFAMGIVMYELLTGERCFKGETDFETLEAVRKAEIAFPIDGARRISSAIQNITLKCLAKDVNARFEDVSAFLDHLRLAERELETSTTSFDLKRFLFDLFHEELKAKKIKEEELDAGVKDFLDRFFDKTYVTQRKTKVLVGQEVPEPDDATMIHPDTVISLKKKNVPIPVTVPRQGKKFGFKKQHAYGTFIFLLLLSVLFFNWVPDHPKNHLSHSDPYVASNKGLMKMRRFPQTDWISKPAVVIVPEPVPTFHSQVLITVDPADSQIVITSGKQKWSGNGTYQLAQDLKDPLKLTVKVTKEGYSSWSKDIVVDKQNPNFEEVVHLSKILYGTLSVQAKPWARITVGNASYLAESSLVKKVPVGSYVVKAFFPPTSRLLTANIVVVENGSVNCRVSFGDAESISCH